MPTSAAIDWLGRVDTYVHALADGSIFVSKWTRLAAQRHLHDLAASKTDAFPWNFDEARALRAIRFCQSLRWPKGDVAGQRIILPDWALWWTASLFGWVSKGTPTIPTGSRRWQYAYGWVPRGNCKSPVLAANSLYAAFYSGEQADCYTVATTSKQARIVWGASRSMARGNKTLVEKLGLDIGANTISRPDTESSLTPLASRDDHLDGLNISWCVVDELHVVTGGVWDVLRTGLKRSSATIASISTAGMNSAGLGRDQYLYCRQVLSGEVKDDRTFVLIFEAPEGADPFDPKTWEAANPCWGGAVRPDVIAAEAERAKKNSRSRAAFMVKRLNVWQDSATPWLDTAKWDASYDPTLNLDAFRGETCWAGVDLGQVDDLSARALVFPETRGDGRQGYAIFCDTYLPTCAVTEGRNDAYPGWVQDGWLTEAGDFALDDRVIADQLLKDRDTFALQGVAYDPTFAGQLARDLKGEGIETIECRTNRTMLTEPMVEFEKALLSGVIRHNGNPALRWQIGNVIADKDNGGRVYPRKENKHSPKHIDGAVAVLNAFKGCLSSPPAPPTPWFGMVKL